MDKVIFSQRKKRLIKFSLIGTVLISIACAVAICDPLELIVQNKLSIHDGSFLFNLWQKPPLDVYISVYIFNVTNEHNFLNGIDKKLNLVQVGPYVYQEFLENQNATFNANGTLSYNPVRRVEFVLEKSIGDPMNDIVTVPNIALLGASSLASKLSIFAAMALGTLMSSMKAPPLLNLTVYDFLWGYDDPLVTIGSTLLPNIVSFNRLGILDRLFDDGQNSVTINLPTSVNIEANQYIRPSHEFEDTPLKEYLHSDPETLKRSKRDTDDTENDLNIRPYSIDTWNGSPGLKHWGYKSGSKQNTACNTLTGSYDGSLFPQNISQNEVFKVYRKAFCRTLPIKFTHAGKQDGLDAYWFALADNAFDDDIDDVASSCYCSSGQCLKKGLGNITPCYFNIPVAVSLPHFYKSDPTLLDGIDGMKPDPLLHESEIILQPRLGVPMRVHSRMQLNLLIGRTKFNKVIRPFEDTVLPILWVEISVERLTIPLLILLHLLFNVFPYIQTGIICLFILIGVSLFAFAALTCFCLPTPNHDYNPKRDIRYSAIYMFPYIRREFERYGEKEDENRIEAV